MLVSGEIAALSESDSSDLEYFLPPERKTALEGMGLYFEEIPLLSQCAFAEVCAAAKAGGGVASSCYSPFGAWMGRLADAKHESSLVSQVIPTLADGAVLA